MADTPYDMIERVAARIEATFPVDAMNLRAAAVILKRRRGDDLTWADYWDYDRDNPKVYAFLEQDALAWFRRFPGRHYSMHAVKEDVRYGRALPDDADGFKIKHGWIAWHVRRFAANYPQYAALLKIQKGARPDHPDAGELWH